MTNKLIKNYIYLDSIYSSTGCQQSELSTASPNPGVSTTVRVRFTPFSFNIHLLVSTRTVLPTRKEGPGCSLPYMSAKNIVLIKVDLPRPDLPITIFYIKI